MGRNSKAPWWANKKQKKNGDSVPPSFSRENDDWFSERMGAPANDNEIYNKFAKIKSKDTAPKKSRTKKKVRHEEKTNVNSNSKSSSSSKATNASDASKRGPKISTNPQISIPTLSSLPVYENKTEIISKINSNKVTCIQGDTGCGKTTGVPVIIAEAEPRAKILTLMPKKRAAQRVTEYLQNSPDLKRIFSKGDLTKVAMSFVGGTGNSRFIKTSDVKIVQATYGKVLQALQHEKGFLGSFTHVIMDEILNNHVHERDTETDLVATIAKLCFAKLQNPPKLVIMSATMDATLFADFFRDANTETDDPDSVAMRAPLYVGGKCFPVTDRFLDDLLPKTETVQVPGTLRTKTVKKKRGDWRDKLNWKTVQTIEKLCGATVNNSSIASSTASDADIKISRPQIHRDLPAVLADIIWCCGEPGKTVAVFLPGLQEIQEMNAQLGNLLLSGTDAGSSSKKRDNTKNEKKIFDVHELYGSQADDEQDAALAPPEAGKIKVVLCTNMIESSVTIRGLKVVIDLGLHKSMVFDCESGRGALQQAWISKASAKQRKGRVGRGEPGLCVKLYPKSLHSEMEEYDKAAMQVTPLELTYVNTYFICEKLQMTVTDDDAENPVTLNTEQLLGRVPQPPNSRAVELAAESLVEKGAFVRVREDAQNSCGGNGSATETATYGLQPTPLAHMIRGFGNVSIEHVVLLYNGITFGMVPDALIFAACLSNQDPFTCPSMLADRLKFAKDSNSDLITIRSLVVDFLKFFIDSGDSVHDAVLNYSKEVAVQHKRLKSILYSMKGMLGVLQRNFKMVAGDAEDGFAKVKVVKDNKEALGSSTASGRILSNAAQELKGLSALLFNDEELYQSDKDMSGGNAELGKISKEAKNKIWQDLFFNSTSDSHRRCFLMASFSKNLIKGGHGNNQSSMSDFEEVGFSDHLNCIAIRFAVPEGIWEYEKSVNDFYSALLSKLQQATGVCFDAEVQVRPSAVSKEFLKAGSRTHKENVISLQCFNRDKWRLKVREESGKGSGRGNSNGPNARLLLQLKDDSGRFNFKSAGRAENHKVSNPGHNSKLQFSHLQMRLETALSGGCFKQYKEYQGEEYFVHDETWGTEEDAAGNKGYYKHDTFRFTIEFQRRDHPYKTDWLALHPGGVTPSTAGITDLVHEDTMLVMAFPSQYRMPLCAAMSDTNQRLYAVYGSGLANIPHEPRAEAATHSQGETDQPQVTLMNGLSRGALVGDERRRRPKGFVKPESLTVIPEAEFELMQCVLETGGGNCFDDFNRSKTLPDSDSETRLRVNRLRYYMSLALQPQASSQGVLLDFSKKFRTELDLLIDDCGKCKLLDSSDREGLKFDVFNSAYYFDSEMYKVSDTIDPRSALKQVESLRRGKLHAQTLLNRKYVLQNVAKCKGFNNFKDEIELDQIGFGRDFKDEIGFGRKEIELDHLSESFMPRLDVRAFVRCLPDELQEPANLHWTGPTRHLPPLTVPKLLWKIRKNVLGSGQSDHRNPRNIMKHQLMKPLVLTKQRKEEENEKKLWQQKKKEDREREKQEKEEAEKHELLKRERLEQREQREQEAKKTELEAKDKMLQRERQMAEEDERLLKEEEELLKKQEEIKQRRAEIKARREEQLEASDISNEKGACPVCWEAYDDENGHLMHAMHPCGHTACKKCLKRLRSCPNCRANIIAHSRVYI